jgi:hypothetical protein
MGPLKSTDTIENVLADRPSTDNVIELTVRAEKEIESTLDLEGEIEFSSNTFTPSITNFTALAASIKPPQVPPPQVTTTSVSSWLGEKVNSRSA